MNEIKRICIYPKDIMRITGKSERSARKQLNKIKEHFNKKEYQLVTKEELSIYFGIDLSVIETYLID